MSTKNTSRTRREPVATALRSENRKLCEQLAKLAALTDHYYCAYREARALLDRREREMAQLRRQLDAKPVLISS